MIAHIRVEKDVPDVGAGEWRWHRPGECSVVDCYEPARWALAVAGVINRRFCEAHGPGHPWWSEPHWREAFERKAVQLDLFDEVPAGGTCWVEVAA